MDLIGSLTFNREPEEFLDYLRYAEYTTPAELEDLSGQPEQVGENELVYAWNALDEAENPSKTVNRQYFYLEPSDVGGPEFVPSEHSYPVSAIDPHALYTKREIQTFPPVTQLQIRNNTFYVHISRIPSHLLTDSSYPQSFQFVDAVDTGTHIEFYDNENDLVCELENSRVIPTVSKLKLAEFTDSFTLSAGLRSYLVSTQI